MSNWPTNRGRIFCSLYIENILTFSHYRSIMKLTLIFPFLYRSLILNAKKVDLNESAYTCQTKIRKKAKMT